MSIALGLIITLGGARLGTATTAPSKDDSDVGSPVTNGSVAVDTGYPKYNDNDTDNTGAGTKTVTWRFTFGTGVANANNIAEIAIVDSISSPTGALMRGTFTAFNKTSNDTLKFFINHSFAGV